LAGPTVVPIVEPRTDLVGSADQVNVGHIAEILSLALTMGNESNQAKQSAGHIAPIRGRRREHHRSLMPRQFAARK
jgi:hypothetical protein